MHLSASIELDSKSGMCQIDGVSYPMIGFGTYPLTGHICTQAVKEALEAGYRVIDTATRYSNFEAIAQALKDVDRGDVYIISKVWHDMLQPENVRLDLEKTLEQLQIEYLDTYLIHWPNSQVPIDKTLRAMEELRQDKKIRHIGLSNVSFNHLKKALAVGVPISWVQVEMHPYFCDFELLKLCKEKCIAVQAWSPLGRGRICDDALIAKIAKKYGKTPAQLALRWIIQHLCMPLPSSTKAKHIHENKEIADFFLAIEEMQEIDQRAKMGERKRIMKEKAGFTDEFDFSYEECWPNGG
ncbi:MAG: aldo/keto reductase [Rhabdochlamydiaceae bacterium]|jgi:diketogulonate reductase-like aldo/keto reductase